MKIYKHMFFGQYTLLCHLFLYEISSTKALVGNNVVPAKSNEFPFIAAIIRRTQNFTPQSDFICTGILISKRDILTADHCFEDEHLNGLKVLVGSNDLLSAVNYYPNWWISYDCWAEVAQEETQGLVHDISILRLTQYVDSAIPFAKLDFVSYKNLKGKDVITIGWGETKNEKYPTLLQTANLQILSREDCRSRAYKLSGKFYRIDENLLCSIGNPFVLSMEGDSGGPLIYKYKIIAINRGTCPNLKTAFHSEKMNIHTNIFFYKEYYHDITSYN